MTSPFGPLAFRSLADNFTASYACHNDPKLVTDWLIERHGFEYICQILNSGWERRAVTAVDAQHPLGL